VWSGNGEFLRDGDEIRAGQLKEQERENQTDNSPRSPVRDHLVHAFVRYLPLLINSLLLEQISCTACLML
jgi:hypothetical protein